MPQKTVSVPELPFNIRANVVALIKVMLQSIELDWDMKSISKDFHVANVVPLGLTGAERNDGVMVSVRPSDNGNPGIYIFTQPETHLLLRRTFFQREASVYYPERRKIGQMELKGDTSMIQALLLDIPMIAAGNTFMRQNPYIYDGVRL